MKSIMIFLCVILISFSRNSAWAAVWPGEKPKLVVVMVIDQFRADYLSRYQSKFSKNGFKALMAKGAYFPYGEYDVLQSMTGPGHATILTGSYPYQSGIPVNDWYDQKSKTDVYCVGDSKFDLVGLPIPRPDSGVSPKNLIGTTVGDELKNADFPSKVISVALKDRAAILLGGHRADFAFWYDSESGKWISSKFYLSDEKLPSWVEKLNTVTKAAKCNLIETCGVDLTVKAVAAAIENYKLGQGPATDIIAVSFSSHDIIGHKFGPNSEEIIEVTLAEDKAMAEIQAIVKKSVPGGLDKVTFVLTGDHGVSPTPDYLQANKIEAGTVDEAELIKQLNESLTQKYGTAKKGDWISYAVDFNFYLNQASIDESKLTNKDLMQFAKDFLFKKDIFATVFSRDDVENNRLPAGLFERQIKKTFFKGRSGDVIGLLKPFYIGKSRNKANHMTGYSYDRTVPILFSGFGIRDGVFGGKAEVVDIAPTLSFMLGTIPPALSEGKVLYQALKISK